MDLPIDAVLPQLIDSLQAHGRAVLQAPPGAGKTTRVPLALLAHVTGRIVMLEPRRLAARAAAERLAATLGEVAGQIVGYRMRGATAVSDATRIEVVTEGLLIRMIQNDAGLDGIGCIIFDEFHERSLDADLGLALVWEARRLLRDDLWVLVMSATLDAAPVAALLDDAPVITSFGRAFEVQERWLPAPLPRGQRFEAAMAALIAQAVADDPGGVLAFLPGEGEIRRVQAMLDLPDCAVRPLYGALPLDAQRAAIAPGGPRKVVLATSIAETSLTIEDVRIVIDGGRARRARFDPGSGMTRLVTERASRAEATQRAGRAGRVAPGICYKLWTRGADGALPAFAPAGIETGDLTALALELALWGTPAAQMSFLTPPPAAALAEAMALLTDLGAFADGRITAAGRRMAVLPVHPRLAHMMQCGGSSAANLAALLSDRAILRGHGADLSLRLRALKDPAGFGLAPAAVARLRDEAKRLRLLAGPDRGLTPPQMAALAYPDRIALRRAGDAPRWLLSGGKGAAMSPADPLAASRLLVVTDTDGDPREATIRQAIPIADAELRVVLGDRIAWHDTCAWSRREGRVIARRQERLGAIVLDDRHWSDAPPEALARAMLEGVREIGLAPDPPARRFLSRIALSDPPPFDPRPEALLKEAETWLLPYLTMLSAAAWRRFDLLPALRARLDPAAQQALDRDVPGHVVTPLGRRLPVDYDGDAPEIAVRVQELYGSTVHPRIAGRPLRIVLLSPGGKPVQVTQDLPGFWAGSWADVRRDMRARYPRHPWPEDPTQADPTTRARPRKVTPRKAPPRKG